MSRIRRRDTNLNFYSVGLCGRGGFVATGWTCVLCLGDPISYGRKRVAVFVDGAFWHGHPSAFTPGKSGAYWDEKINGNVRRDREADATLVAMGWIVLRLWDFEISQQLERCIERVEAALSAAQQRQEPNPQSRIGGLRAEEAHG